MIMLLLVLVLFLSGCSSKVDPISGEGWTEATITEMPGYGEYSDKVDDMIDYTLLYFASFSYEYNESDGLKLKTFDHIGTYYLDQVMEIDTTFKLVDNGDYTESMILLKLQEKVLRAENVFWDVR